MTIVKTMTPKPIGMPSVMTPSPMPRGEKRLVEGDQQDEAVVDDHHEAGSATSRSASALAFSSWYAALDWIFSTSLRSISVSSMGIFSLRERRPSFRQRWNDQRSVWVLRSPCGDGFDTLALAFFSGIFF